MLANFFDWYFTSLAEFWSFAVRIRLLHILLIVALVCWLRRKGCFKDWCKSSCCCWFGSCEKSSDDDEADACCSQDGHAHAEHHDHEEPAAGADDSAQS